MSWTAIVPVKCGEGVKSRLAGRLSAKVRAELVAWMARRIIDRLGRTPGIDQILIASEAKDLAPGNRLPIQYTGAGKGLNEDLEQARMAAGGGSYLIVLGDLPLLETGDILALLHAAEGAGAAIAPDRHGTGTNALAIADNRPFPLVFGPDSFEKHLAATGRDTAIVRRPGLAFDIDTPDDLDCVLKLFPVMNSPAF